MLINTQRINELVLISLYFLISAPRQLGSSKSTKSLPLKGRMLNSSSSESKSSKTLSEKGRMLDSSSSSSYSKSSKTLPEKGRMLDSSSSSRFSKSAKSEGSGRALKSKVTVQTPQIVAASLVVEDVDGLLD